MRARKSGSVAMCRGRAGRCSVVAVRRLLCVVVVCGAYGGGNMGLGWVVGLGEGGEGR